MDKGGAGQRGGGRCSSDVRLMAGRCTGAADRRLGVRLVSCGSGGGGDG